MNKENTEIIQTSKSLHLLETTTELIQKVKECRISMLEYKVGSDRHTEVLHFKKAYSKYAIEKLYYLKYEYFDKMSEAKYREIGMELCEGAYENLGIVYREESDNDEATLKTIDDLIDALKYLIQEKLIRMTRSPKSLLN